MNLVVFDLDGTLLDTNAVDDECFVRAWREVGIDCSGQDWSSFEHVTDAGIANALLTGVMNAGETLQRVKALFIELLGRAADERPRAFCAIAGAADMLQRLEGAGWAAVVATGAWEASAMLKLRAAALPTLPLASADDHPSREGIVRRALALAGDRFLRVVLVGDAPWDVEVARRLSLPFVGIGDERRLRGASHVLPHFVPFERVIRALETAAVPDRV